MTVKVAKWTIDEYHRMIECSILNDRKTAKMVIIDIEMAFALILEAIN